MLILYRMIFIVFLLIQPWHKSNKLSGNSVVNSHNFPRKTLGWIYCFSGHGEQCSGNLVLRGGTLSPTRCCANRATLLKIIP